MTLIKGQSVILIVREQIGADELNVPIYRETEKLVENVLISPLTAEEKAEDLAYYKKVTAYELHIPKKNTDSWENTAVLFYGRRWETVGDVRVWMEENTPLEWNKKIRVAAYG